MKRVFFERLHFYQSLLFAALFSTRSATCFLQSSHSSGPTLLGKHHLKGEFGALQSTMLPEDNEASNKLMKALRARQLELGQEKWEREQKWRNADCASGIKVSLPDWVRRVDVEYPLVACGTSTGKIFVAHLETGTILSESPDTENSSEPELKKLESTLQDLYGDFDGGGTIAITFRGDLICASDRKGSVQLWRLDSTTGRLISQGKLKAFKRTLVTSLHLDEEYLWVGTKDGRVEAFSLDGDLPLSLQTVPDLSWKFQSTVLSLAFCENINCAVVTLSEGSIELLSTEDDNGPLCSFYPPWSSNVHALSATIVAHKEDDEGNFGYSIAAGGNDGSLFLQRLQMDEDGEVDDFRPFASKIIRMNPRHSGPIKCLASPIPGLLISAGHDGSMRVWDVDDEMCLYQFVGYKVWLGSLWTDGVRIVSDGSDNTLVVHNFEESSEEL